MDFDPHSAPAPDQVNLVETKDRDPARRDDEEPEQDGRRPAEPMNAVQEVSADGEASHNVAGAVLDT